MFITRRNDWIYETPPVKPQALAQHHQPKEVHCWPGLPYKFMKKGSERLYPFSSRDLYNIFDPSVVEAPYFCLPVRGHHPETFIPQRFVASSSYMTYPLPLQLRYLCEWPWYFGRFFICDYIDDQQTIYRALFYCTYWYI